MIDIYEPPEGEPKLARPSAESVDRIYVDTVAHGPETMKYCYEMFGPEKIMFGTDHPFMHWEIYREMMDGLECTDAERELIYHTNAETLLGLAG
jgi:predicted TIM-barrel fold metal-dependent hydrolase